MAYITREDGERFVIPSYRDVLMAKNKSTLKKEILLLSRSYGEYITLQRKNPAQYEVAFSPDPGYLLGESIWQHFDRPQDLIYCEAIPNTTEAILVIVKAGSVYLDGQFPLDSISEELVIFLTQTNHFEIYTYGDVPLSETPQEEKFSFEASSVKSFTVLTEPVFPTLPLMKMYQLQLVETMLKAHGIGVFPLRQLIMGLAILILLWVGWSYLRTREVTVPEFILPSNPYAQFNVSLTSPAPDQELAIFLNKLELLFSLPGWMPMQIDYSKGVLSVMVQSIGSKTQVLFDWARNNNWTVAIKPEGIFLTTSLSVPNRPIPTKIYPLKEVIGAFIDKLSMVYPGNHIKLEGFTDKGRFTEVKMTISIDNITPGVLMLIGKQFENLPFVLTTISLTVTNGSLAGAMTLQALGS